jgi:hypothetical protein
MVVPSDSPPVLALNLIRCLLGPLDPGSGMEKNHDLNSGSRMNIPYHISENLELSGLKYLNSLMPIRIQDPDRIQNKHHGSAKLDLIAERN